MATPIPINQCEFTLAEVVEATAGTFVAANSSVSFGGGVQGKRPPAGDAVQSGYRSGAGSVGNIRGVSIDTRSIEAGSIFIALRGEASDGHNYLPQAAAGGAVAAIVETGRRHPALDCIEVADTLSALGRLASHHLARTREFYERYGAKTIVIARFVPIVRTFAPFVAGIGQMRYARFLFYNVAGGVGWIVILVAGGYLFGNIPVVRRNFSLVIFAIIVLSILPALVEVARQRRRGGAAAR